MSIDLTTTPATSLTIQPEAKPYQYTTGKKVAATEAQFLGHEGGFNFSDLLDIINPLQHIPIVSTIYRKLTGDTISPGASVLGGGLLGGLTGLVSSVADAIFAGETGHDTGDTLFSALTGDQKAKSDATLKTAQNTVDEKQTALTATGDATGLAALATTQNLITASSENADTVFAAANAVQDNSSSLPAATLASVKQASAKYKEAQILAQQQNLLLDATKNIGESQPAKKLRKQDDDFSLFNTQPYPDWLSQIS